MDESRAFYGQAWVAVGDETNWEKGLENGIWGLRPELHNHWERMNPGDLVLFYCKAPIKGFFGAGVIRSKFKQTLPYWIQEIEQGKVIWPFRFEFDVTHLIPFARWSSDAISNKPFGLAILAGMNPVKDFNKALSVLDALAFTVIQPTEPTKEIVSNIFEIGKIQRMIVEANVQIDNAIIDVVWKRTIRSVPTFAFCVDLAGEFKGPIGTLKHAFDLWNSRPFLITEADRLGEVNKLASGYYHKFAPSLRVLSVPQVMDLYESKKTYFELEEKYGLR